MIGVDEVGRGCLAGPLLIVAARQTSKLPGGIKDSKLLTPLQRREMLDLLSNCCEFGQGWVRATEIDKYGVAGALRLGTNRALRTIRAEADEEIIMDGKANYLAKKFKNGRCLIDADNLVPIVSAASIYAKVTRDDFMVKLSRKYPAYSFEKHVGYCTKAHLHAIKSFGVIKFVHRTSYKPVADLVAMQT